MRCTVAALCALLLAGCGHSSSHRSSADLKKLVLTPQDMPGYRAFAEGPTASLDVQGTTRSNFQRFGREGGWVERLRRPSPALILVSTVDVFHDPKGAQADLTAYANDFARQQRSGLAKRVRAPRVGDRAIAAEILAPGGEREFAVAWNSGSATASVTLLGPSSLHLADAVALARKQQGKLSRD